MHREVPSHYYSIRYYADRYETHVERAKEKKTFSFANLLLLYYLKQVEYISLYVLDDRRL